MQAIDTSHEFDVPADAIWRLLEDFGNIRRWWPATNPAVQIERVEIEGEGVGLTRHIYNAGVAAPVSERLDFIDPAARTLKLSIVGTRPAGLTWYQATGRVEPLPGKRCRLHYHAEFTTVPGGEESARDFLHLVYGLMFEGLGVAAIQAGEQKFFDMESKNKKQIEPQRSQRTQRTQRTQRKPSL